MPKYDLDIELNIKHDPRSLEEKAAEWRASDAEKAPQCELFYVIALGVQLGRENATGSGLYQMQWLRGQVSFTGLGEPVVSDLKVSTDKKKWYTLLRNQVRLAQTLKRVVQLLPSVSHDYVSLVEATRYAPGFVELYIGGDVW